ncbi:MAG TPA: hypothetical protein VM122_13995 [Usitatibacter sp.]|nr:hypothetical protein [Usitatibacter sp.]
MKRIYRWTLAAMTALFFVTAQAASPLLPDYSDLWSVPGESGWGVHVTLQDDVVFLVIYVHDTSSEPRFYVATDMRPTAQSPSQQPVFSGALYRTQGSPFAAAFDPARFDAKPVGNATLRLVSSGSAVLSYDVQGVAVTKTLARQALRALSLASDYLGGTFVSTNGCTAGAGLPALSFPGTIKVAQAGDDVVIDTRFEPGFTEVGTCRLTGKLFQEGSIATIRGTYACEFSAGVNPMSGTFEIIDLEAAEKGFSGRYRAIDGACVHTGRIGGIRRGYTVVAPPEDP